MSCLPLKSYDLKLKILLVGDKAAGKWHLADRFCGKGFPSKTISVNGKRIRLRIWVACGMRGYTHAQIPMYKKADGIILVYDVTRRASFESLDRFWMNFVDVHGTDNVEKVIVGNKSDLTYQRKVPESEGRQFAEGKGLKFFETSAKIECRAIQDAFIQLTEQILERAKTDLENKEMEVKRRLEVANDPVSQNQSLFIGCLSALKKSF